MLFKEIGAADSENHTKPINTFYGQNAELLINKAGGTHSYHWALTCQTVMKLSLKTLLNAALSLLESKRRWSEGKIKLQIVSC
jgi:hypothetical protein